MIITQPLNLRTLLWHCLLLACLAAGIPSASAQYPASPQITRGGTAVRLEEYASLPLSTRTTGTYPPPIDLANQLARVSFLRSEPPDFPLSSARFFVSDLNRNLYILDKTTKTFTTYINFEEVFPKFDNSIGYAGGLVTFAFDPGYATNGIFYTVHTEDPTKSGPVVPVNTHLTGFNTNGYTTTVAANPPAGTVTREAILVEWTDANPTNTTFEGSAREILRVGFNEVIHPMADLIFNPLASAGDPDYRNLYISNGDGGSGETSGPEHSTPQRLDVLQGKILRITPDLNLRPADAISSNGRYRIPVTGPDPNPFASLTLIGVKKEIYAFGLRNPHRMSWDPVSSKLIVDDIGLASWEEINIVSKGADYGYAEREGNEQLFVGGANNAKTGSQTSPVTPFPNPDLLTVTGLTNPVTPVYPVAEYSHWDGDSICSGFVYRGTLMPALYGKYLFGDITTGRLFYCDFAEMLAADDGNPQTLATPHELQVVFNGVKRRLFDVLSDKYHQKGGNFPNAALPGGCGGLATGGNDPDGIPYGCGRADIRYAQSGDGELYLLTKSDGMCRKFTAALIPPSIETVGITNNSLTLTWSSISNVTYRVQYKTDWSETAWSNLSDVTATGATASKTDTVAPFTRFYRLMVLP